MIGAAYVKAKGGFFSFNMQYATKFVLLSVFTLIETICLNIWQKHYPAKVQKIPFQVDVRRSKTPLLKLPNQAANPAV